MVNGIYGRDYDDNGHPVYDPDRPLELVRAAVRESDEEHRPAAVVGAIQRMVAGGMDEAVEQSARAHVVGSRLLPAPAFDKLVREERKRLAAANGDGSAKKSNRPPGSEQHRSQLRMAERMAKHYGDQLRYAHGLGWLAWDGARWAIDKDGKPFRAAFAVVKQAIAEADGDASLADDVRTVETFPGIKGIVGLAQYLPPLSVSSEDLDTDPYLFNFKNGTLDLRTLERRDHDPADLITKVAGCGYDPDAAGPEFEKFLKEVLPLQEVREYVQRLTGYAMLGKVIEHLLGIFTGVGLNGKTTLVELLLKGFGDYGIMAEPDLLLEHPFGSHPTGQADLQGVRLAVTQETDQGRKLAVATVKRLTGGDKIRARRMRQDFFEFDPSHTVIMVTNHKPRIPGDDPAAWRRIRVIPFDQVIENPDSGLPDRLALEVPAVMAWAVYGYLDYATSGLAEPEVVTKRTQEYRVSSDAVGRFMAERTLQQQFATVRSRELFTAWAQWCVEVGEEPGSEVDFSDAMANRGHEKFKSSGVMTYKGLGLIATGRNDSLHDDRRYGE